MYATHRGEGLSALPPPSPATAGAYVLNAAENGLTSLSGVEDYGALTALDVSYNAIASVGMESLGQLSSLTRLNMAHNALSSLGDLAQELKSGNPPPPLAELDVSHNSLVDSMPLVHLTSLVSLNLASNALTSLAGISSLVLLSSLDVRSNLLASLDDVRDLGLNTALATLRLDGNPLCGRSGSTTPALARSLRHIVPSLVRVDAHGRPPSPRRGSPPPRRKPRASPQQKHNPRPSPQRRRQQEQRKQSRARPGKRAFSHQVAVLSPDRKSAVPASPGQARGRRSRPVAHPRPRNAASSLSAGLFASAGIEPQSQFLRSLIGGSNTAAAADHNNGDTDDGDDDSDNVDYLAIHAARAAAVDAGSPSPVRAQLPREMLPQRAHVAALEAQLLASLRRQDELESQLAAQRAAVVEIVQFYEQDNKPSQSGDAEHEPPPKQLLAVFGLDARDVAAGTAASSAGAGAGAGAGPTTSSASAPATPSQWVASPAPRVDPGGPIPPPSAKQDLIASVKRLRAALFT